MAFIGLLAVLFIGQVFMNESFYNFTDASGSRADASGNITLSLSDLLSLLGAGYSSKKDDKDDDKDDDKKDKYYRNMRADMMADVKYAVKKEMLSGKFSGLYGRGKDKKIPGGSFF